MLVAEPGRVRRQCVSSARALTPTPRWYSQTQDFKRRCKDIRIRPECTAQKRAPGWVGKNRTLNETKKLWGDIRENRKMLQGEGNSSTGLKGTVRNWRTKQGPLNGAVWRQ